MFFRKKPVEPVITDPHLRDIAHVGNQLVCDILHAWDRRERRLARHKWLWRIFFLALASFFFLSSGERRTVVTGALLHKPLSGIVGGKGTGNVAVIKIEDEIGGDYLGENSSSNTVQYLQESFELAISDKNLAGVVLYINSPGGSANASAQLCRGVKKFRKQNPKLPVIAYVSQSAYSGGYYVAVCAERIIADPEATVANIGVIMRLFNTSRLGNVIGVTENEISTGPRKNAGSQWKKLSRNDRAMIQQSLAGPFDHFLRAVSDGRGIPLETLRKESQKAFGITSGAWFSAEDALKKNLIDEIIPIEDFFETEALFFAQTRKFAEIRYVQYEKREEISSILGKRSTTLARSLVRAIHEEMSRPTMKLRAE